MRVSLAATVAASVLVLAACGSDAPEADEPAAEANAAVDTPEQESADSKTDENTPEEAAEDEESEEEEPEAQDDSGELGLGGTAEIGEYRVAVTEVQLNANDAVKAANSFNEDPEGQYALVSLAVTYIGDEEGDPWLDLSIEMAGSDSRIYDSSSCSAVAPNSAMDVPTLTNGGKAEFSECFDMPVEALEAPKVYVEETLSFNSERIIWDPSKTAPEGASSEAEDDAAPAAAKDPDALAVGASTELGEYTVAVTEVVLDANDALKAANSFNDDPSGRCVLVSLDVTYTGDEEGDPWLDLSVELAGSDSRIYDTSSCSAVAPNSPFELPTLTNGGKGEFSVCFDAPEAALNDPHIHVTESLSFDDERAVWIAQ